MKRPPFFLIVVILCAVPTFGQTESEIRDRIVGTWKLVSTEEVMKDGTTRPYPSFGPHAKGFLMYQREGYMCAELMNPDRPKSADPRRSTPEEKIAAAEGSFAIVAGTRSMPSKSGSFICQKWLLILIT